ncbi:MAG: hypothetical protein AB8I08_00200 [Sandaracinaceae bacterium]
MTYFRSSLASALFAALLLLACNRHEVEDGCLPACDAEDEALFEDCVALGGGPDACRPGNRRCCALAAECLGEIGDQVVEAEEVCGAETYDIDLCSPPCSIYPDVEIFWEDCLDGSFADAPDGCGMDDPMCCARVLQCLGEVGDLAVINGPPGCCAEDEDCAEDAYCDVDYHCRPSDCATCGEPRSCREGECTCLDVDGMPVVQCPDEELCGPSGRCIPADPCADVECEDGETCVPFVDDDDEPVTECLVFCVDDPSICGPGGLCDDVFCIEDPVCFVNSDCDEDHFCELPDPDAPGTCEACRPGEPDLCGGGDSDCDDVRDEDCEEDICGNDILDGEEEECDGPDLGDAVCSSLPGFSSGYLFCGDDCRFDTTFCSDEVCDSTDDEDEDDFIGCADWDCFSDAAAGCCSPSPGPDGCDSYDSDCDFIVDEDCASGPAEICSNGYDDDFDGDIDCDDSDCVFPDLGPCDGFDNDCDGIIDNEDPMFGTSCGSNIGACVFGALECGSTGSLECVGGVLPSYEFCDDVDNDCDGLVDNGDEPIEDCRGGDFCSSSSFCGSAGSCILDATPELCDDFEECTIDTCDPASRCTHTPRVGDAPCAGGDGMCLPSGTCSL